MTRSSMATSRFLRKFCRSERGAVTVEFLFISIFFIFLIFMTFEVSVHSLRQVRLDNALDKTVRDVRIGKLSKPTHEELVERLCAYAKFVTNCETSVRLEMIRLDPRNFVAPSSEFSCIDRAEEDQPAANFANGNRNEMMLLRACASFEPVLPGSPIGLAVSNNAGEYEMVAVAGYVMEPL